MTKITKTYTAVVQFATGRIYMASGFTTLTSAYDALETFTAECQPSTVIRSYVKPCYGHFAPVN